MSLANATDTATASHYALLMSRLQARLLPESYTNLTARLDWPKVQPHQHKLCRSPACYTSLSVPMLDAQCCHPHSLSRTRTSQHGHDISSGITGYNSAGPIAA